MKTLNQLSKSASHLSKSNLELASTFIGEFTDGRDALRGIRVASALTGGAMEEIAWEWGEEQEQYQRLVKYEPLAKALGADLRAQYALGAKEAEPLREATSKRSLENDKERREMLLSSLSNIQQMASDVRQMMIDGAETQAWQESKIYVAAEDLEAVKSGFTQG